MRALGLAAEPACSSFAGTLGRSSLHVLRPPMKNNQEGAPDGRNEVAGCDSARFYPLPGAGRGGPAEGPCQSYPGARKVFVFGRTSGGGFPPDERLCDISRVALGVPRTLGRLARARNLSCDLLPAVLNRSSGEGCPDQRERSLEKTEPKLKPKPNVPDGDLWRMRHKTKTDRAVP